VAKERKNARLCARSIRAAAFCTFLGLGNRLGLHAFPSGRIDAILRAPLTAGATASFTCALHARCIHGCTPRESDATSPAGGSVFFPFHFVFFSLLSE